MNEIKSYLQLKEQKALKKEQLAYIKARLYTDYYYLLHTKDQVKTGLDWWQKIMLGIEIYKKAKVIFDYFRKDKNVEQK